MNRFKIKLKNGSVAEAIPHPHDRDSTIECSVVDRNGQLLDYLDFPTEKELRKYFENQVDRKSVN